MKNPETIDEYIKSFPKETQEKLQVIRETIKCVVPEATEAISYRMPTFKLNGKNLIHFAAFKNHIGLYPLPHAIEAFKKEISAYVQGKGSIQLPLDQPMPIELIKMIVQFRLEENKPESDLKKK